MPIHDPVPPPKSPLGGGAFIVLGLLGGAGVGYAFYQPTIGLLIGGALGAAIAGWLAWRGR